MRTRPQGRGRVARRTPGTMNGTEAAYKQQVLDVAVASGEYATVEYERITIKLADDTRYTPDFFILTKDGLIEFHEVKGFFEDHAKVKIKVAADQHPWFTFKLVMKRAKKDGGGWEIKEVGTTNGGGQ